MNLKEIKEVALGTETRNIRKHFSPDELVGLKEEFFDTDLKLNDKQEELDSIKDTFKEAMKPLKESTAVLRKKIRNRFVDIDYEVYAVANQESGNMEYYSVQDGELMDERKLRPDEKQLRLKVAASNA